MRKLIALTSLLLLSGCATYHKEYLEAMNRINHLETYVNYVDETKQLELYKYKLSIQKDLYEVAVPVTLKINGVVSVVGAGHEKEARQIAKNIIWLKSMIESLEQLISIDKKHLGMK